jgi:hypothetical protein
MAETSCVIPASGDCERPTAIISDRSRSLKHIQRARTILHSDERLPVQDVVVRRDQPFNPPSNALQKPEWKAASGQDASAGQSPSRPSAVAKGLSIACLEPRVEATHWTGRVVAQIVDISLRAVQRIWGIHRLRPHRVRTF